jgi:hypothetical protein
MLSHLCSSLFLKRKLIIFIDIKGVEIEKYLIINCSLQCTGEQRQLYIKKDA